MSMLEESIPVTQLPPQPTETLSVPINPPWHWRDVGWLVAIFMLGALLLGVVYSAALKEVGQMFGPAIQVSGALSQVYLLLILGVYWFAIRRSGATWAQLGVRRPRTAWMLAVPAIFVIQLMLIAFVNLAVIGLFTDGGFENPQLDALEEALASPTPNTAAIVPPAENSPSPTSATADSAPSTESEVNPSAPVDSQMDRISRNVKLSTSDLIWLILAIGVVAPFSEELFFRGMIYPLQRRNQRVSVAIILNGLLFAASHMLPVLMPALFIIGVILAWVRERSGSIWPAFIIHMMQNSMAIYAIYTFVNRGTGS